MFICSFIDILLCSKNAVKTFGDSNMHNSLFNVNVLHTSVHSFLPKYMYHICTCVYIEIGSTQIGGGNIKNTCREPERTLVESYDERLYV